MITTLLTCGMLLPLAALSLSQDPQVPPQGQAPPAAHALEIFSLAPFAAAPEELPSVPYGTLLRLVEDAPELVHPSGSSFDDEAPRRILTMLHPRAFEDPQVEISRHGNRLEVYGPPELLRQVRDDLQAVTAEIGRPIEVELAVVALPDGELPPTVPSAEAIAQLMPVDVAAARARNVTRSGRVVTFDRLRWTRYVRDVDAEVAQKAEIAFGVVDAFVEGVRANVEVHALAGSEDIALFAQFALGRRADRTTPPLLPVTGHPNVDLPVLETAYGAVAGRVPSGGALVVPLGGDAKSGMRAALVLRPRYLAPRSGKTTPIAILPISALCTNALRQRPFAPKPRPRLRDQPPQEFYEVENESPYLDTDRLHEILRAGLPGDPDDIDVWIDGGFVFCAGDEATREAIARTVQALQERLLHNVELRCRLDLVETGGDPLFGEARRDGASLRWHDVAMPCMTGFVSVLFRGTERNVVRGLLPEIAQESTALDVVVDEQSAGLWLCAAPARVGDAVLPSLVVQVTAQGEPQARSQPQGSLHLNDTATSRSSFDAALQPGRALELAGPDVQVGGRGYRGTVTVQANAR